MKFKSAECILWRKDRESPPEFRRVFQRDSWKYPVVSNTAENLSVPHIKYPEVSERPWNAVRNRKSNDQTYKVAVEFFDLGLLDSNAE